MLNSDIDFVAIQAKYLLAQYHLTIAVFLPLTSFKSKIIARPSFRSDSDAFRTAPP